MRGIGQSKARAIVDGPRKPSAPQNIIQPRPSATKDLKSAQARASNATVATI